MYKVYAGTITAGTSPLILNTYADTGGFINSGFVSNDDVTASIQVSISISSESIAIGSVVWEDAYTLLKGEILTLEGMGPIRAIKLTRVAADCAYRAMVSNEKLGVQ